MNLDAIRKTTVCYWSPDDDSFVVVSSLFDSLAGVGDTEEEARKSFEDLLSDALEAFHKGRVPRDRAGRPNKTTVPLNVDVKAETKDCVASLAKKFGCSQGEVIDYITLCYEKKTAAETAMVAEVAPNYADNCTSATIKALAKSLEKLEQEVRKAQDITDTGLAAIQYSAAAMTKKSPKSKKKSTG